MIEGPRSYDFGVAVSSGRIENARIALNINRRGVSIEENFGCHGLLLRRLGVWIYEAIRPRFGSGVKTAVYAGVAAWFLFYCLGSPLLGLGGVSASIWGLFPIEGMILLDLTHLPALCLAVPLGVWIFLRSEFQNHVEANSGGS